MESEFLAKLLPLKLKPGDKVFAVRTSHSPMPEVMPFMKGARMTILSHKRDAWFEAKDCFGFTGLINASKVIPIQEYMAEDWYFNDVTQNMAERYLQKQGMGTFLVRRNPADPDGAIISAKYKSVHHYEIKKAGPVYVHNNKSFKSLKTLIEQSQKEYVLDNKLGYMTHRADLDLPDVPDAPIVRREDLHMRFVTGNVMMAFQNFRCKSPACLPLISGHNYTAIWACRNKKWCVVKNEAGEEGFAPTAYLGTKIPDWFHGKMDKENAEKILNQIGRDGTYLVRERLTEPGHFALSVWCPERVVHVRLLYEKGKITTSSHPDIPTFDTLRDLIQHYHIERVFWTSNDICVRFLFPLCSRESALPDEIQTMDLKSVDLYLKALEEGSEKVRDIRLMVIGHYGAGKTSLTRALLNQHPGTPVESTNGIDVHVKKCKIALSDGKWYFEKDFPVRDDTDSRLVKVVKERIQSESSAGVSPKRVNSGSSAFTFPSQDVATPASFSIESEDDAKIRAILTPSPKESPVGERSQSPVGGISAKVQQRENNRKRNPSGGRPASQNLTDEQLKQITDLLEKEAEKELEDEEGFCNVSVWDFAGQYVFYATHQVFLSPRAIYLLVLDLSKSLDDFVEDEDFPVVTIDIQGRQVKLFGDFWMRSIHTFCGNSPGLPPVLLVGTHLDQVEGTSDQKRKYVEEYFEKFRKMFDGTPLARHIQPEEFCVDNTLGDQQMQELRDAILKVAKRQHHWEQEIPAKWIPLEKALAKRRRHHRIISLGDVHDADAKNEVPIENKEEISLFLRYHNAIGNLIYFDDPHLDDSVVLEPQWIIDAFKCLITANRFCRRHAELRELWEELKDKAILRDDLTTAIWREDKENDFLREKAKILYYMEKLDIIAKAIISKDEVTEVVETDFYFVPSLLRTTRSKDLPKHFTESSCSSSILCISFDEGFVPPSIFHRLLAACLCRWSVLQMSEDIQLYCDVAVFRLDAQHCGCLCFVNNVIEVRVHNMVGDEVSSDNCDLLRRFLMTVLQRELGRYQQNLPFSLCIRCEVAYKTDSAMYSVKTLEQETKLPCLAHKDPHTIHADQVLKFWFPDKYGGQEDMNLRAKWCEYAPPGVQHKLSDKDLSKISRSLGMNWELIGLSLGLSQATVDQCKLDNPLSTAMQIYDMLAKWREVRGTNATFQILVQNLRENSSVTVDWDRIKNVGDGI